MQLRRYVMVLMLFYDVTFRSKPSTDGVQVFLIRVFVSCSLPLRFPPVLRTTGQSDFQLAAVHNGADVQAEEFQTKSFSFFFK